MRRSPAFVEGIMASRFRTCFSEFSGVGDCLAGILRLKLCATLWASLAVITGAPVSMAADFGHGSLPITIEPYRALQLDGKEEIIVSGVVEAGDAGIALRIDDGASSNYASRMNAEQQLSPGPFLLRFPVEWLRATDGRKLNPSDIRRI